MYSPFICSINYAVAFHKQLTIHESKSVDILMWVSVYTSFQNYYSFRKIHPCQKFCQNCSDFGVCTVETGRFDFWKKTWKIVHSPSYIAAIKRFCKMKRKMTIMFHLNYLCISANRQKLLCNHCLLP
jgi:hypothetical protein